MNIQVNLLNEMLKYRKGYFTTTTSILDEMVQNAQRAKATKLDIEFDMYSNTITFTDNGVGCDDVQALITKSQSGWDAVTMANESPAGEGMYSASMIANTLHFFSKTSCTFNFRKLFDDKSLDIVSILPSTSIEGTKIVLSNILAEYNLTNLYTDWLSYTSKHLCFVKLDITIYYKSPKGDMKDSNLSNKLDKVRVNATLDIETPDYIFLYNTNETTTHVYYQDRFVADSQSFYMLGGTLIIKNNNIIDVRLPDRKDIVVNDKFYCFRELLSSNVLSTMANLSADFLNDNVARFLYKTSINLDTKNLRIIENSKWIYNHNGKAYYSIKEFYEIASKSAVPVKFIDAYHYKRVADDIIANNVYNGYDVWEAGDYLFSAINAIYNKNIMREEPTFNGYKTAYKTSTTKNTNALIKELVKTTAYIYSQVQVAERNAYEEYSNILNGKALNLQIPNFNICEVEFENPFDRFEGLYTKATNTITLNWSCLVLADGLITTTAQAKRFVRANAEIILHELAHALFSTHDKTEEHANGIIKLFSIYVNYDIK